MKTLLAFTALIALVFAFAIKLNNDQIEDREYRVQREKLCKSLGGNEYLFWSDTCNKVLQERKTEEIFLPLTQ